MAKNAHASLSPSAAARWMRCEGALAMEAPYPYTTSVYADWGTAAHFLAAECLILSDNAADYLGRTVALWHHAGSSTHGEDFLDRVGQHPDAAGLVINAQFDVDGEMVDCVQTYIDNVRRYAEGSALIEVEQRVDLSGVLDTPDQWGTCDALILTQIDAELDVYELQVHDLKTGKGVKVDAVENEQLMLYALGAYHRLRSKYDIRRVRTVIHQPRIQRAPSEWDLPVDRLLEFGERARVAGHKALAALDVPKPALYDLLTVSEKACQWCKAKAECPAYTAMVFGEATEIASPDDFDLIDETTVQPRTIADVDLERVYPLLGMIEDWCSAVRARVYELFESGRGWPDWKLVEGRRGARQWVDQKVVEERLQQSRLGSKTIYKRTLISPTDAERLLKKEHPRLWRALQQFIEQRAGGHQVVRADDPRPAIKTSADDLDDLFAATESASADAPSADLADLF